MDIVILLVSALILAHFSRHADSRSYHLALLSLFGISYFLLWPYLQFYLKLIGAEQSNNNLIYAFLIVGIVLVSLLPQVRNIKHEYALVMVVTFFATTVSGFIFDREIKNRLSEWAGFFSQAEIRTEVNESWNWYRDDIGGVRFQLPSRWVEQKHKSGLTYFSFNKKKRKIAELRLRCFHNTAHSVAEIIFNYISYDASQGYKTDAKCWANEQYECLVKSATVRNSKPEKWRWLMMDRGMSQNVQLDFVFYSDDKVAKYEARKIVDTTKLLKLQADLPVCISSVDWF